jgi:hypothetical protein
MIRRAVEPPLLDASVRHVGGWETQRAQLLDHEEEQRYDGNVSGYHLIPGRDESGQNSIYF